MERAILRNPASDGRVSGVLLADSLHAGYGAPASVPRTVDLAPLDADLDVFLRFAADSAAGRQRLLLTHSEVFPGTYASTTETTDALLRSVGLRRRARLRAGPAGMQMLSESRLDKFEVLGFAGNSAPDHKDHLYALGEWLGRVLSRQMQALDMFEVYVRPFDASVPASTTVP